MFRSGFVRSLALVVGTFVLASCSETGITNPSAPTEASMATSSAHFVADGHVGQVADGLVGAVADATHLKLKALWWKNRHRKVVRVSQTIDQSGGTITIRETGLTMSFPAGAVTAPIRITVTSDEKYVAYKMEPSGTRFLKDVTVTSSSPLLKSPASRSETSSTPLTSPMTG